MHIATKTTLSILASFFFFACLNPEKYEDVPPPSETVSSDTATPPQDMGQTVDLSSNDTDEGGQADQSPPDLQDVSQEDADSTPTGDVVDVAQEDLVEPLDQARSTQKCVCAFEAAITSPSAQASVLLTGDFFDPEWPTSTEQGALMLSVDAGAWRAEVELSQGQVVEYKYLVEWPGEQQQWCIFDGAWDCDPALGNQVLVVNCGSGPCGSGSE